MILITYYRDIPGIGVFGHAESGESGHDLVCAAASMLVYTLGQYVKNPDGVTDEDFYEEDPAEEDPAEEDFTERENPDNDFFREDVSKRGKVLELFPGMAIIRCRAEGEEEEEVRAVFDAVCNGFVLLARQFPENVTYRLIEGETQYDEYGEEIEVFDEEDDDEENEETDDIDT